MNKLPKLTARERALQAHLVNELVLSSLIPEVADLMRLAAEEILRPNFGKVAVEQKLECGLLEPVTEVDRKISAFLLAGVRSALPGSYSEEELPATAQARRKENLLWLFDPLDGTQEYVDGFFKGVAIQGALLARIDERYLPISGLIYRPATKNLWYTDEIGQARCEFDAKPHLLPKLQRDKILKGAIRKVDPDAELAQFYRVLARSFGEAVDIVECGGAGASFIDLLDGTTDILIANQTRSKSWDIAMAIPLIEARGGFVCDLHGDPFTDLNGLEFRNLEGFMSSIVYNKEELLPLIPETLLKRT